LKKQVGKQSKAEGHEEFFNKTASNPLESQ